MQLAARTAAWAKSGGWVNPYVTDGLVAMWDGEWNAGPGVHDPNATTWKNLIGSGQEDFVLTNVSITDKSLYFDNQNVSVKKSFGDLPVNKSYIFPSVGDATLEVVCDRLRTNGIVLKPTDNSHVGLAFFTTATFSNYVRGKGFKEISLPVGHAYHLACTYLSNTTDSLFVDGNERISDSSDNIGQSQDHVTLGYRVNGINYPFSGNIFVIRLYTRRLLGAEIAANYTIDKARFNLT